MTTRFSKSDIQEAREHLSELLKPGDTVYTKLVHVSRSGMYRVIDLYVIKDNQPVRISWSASMLLEGYDERHEGCKAGGCGMDMGFSLVYNLGRSLYPEWECIGDGCPSNDHSNDWNSPRGAGVVHKGGYALRQEWL